MRSLLMKTLFMVLAVFLCANTSFAQKGTAEPDYYPAGYVGDTWTGEVTAIDEDKREFTLTYKKKDKEESFVGVLPTGYTVKMKDGSDHELKMQELMGMQVRVYYIAKSKK